jgi:exosortase
MFPIPSSYYILITNPLKLMITDISGQIISFMGIPVFRDGNLLFFAGFELEVAEACSGVRSLYSYLMLSCLFTIMSKRLRSKVVLLLSAIPLAIAVNIIRVVGTGILSVNYGPKLAQGFFHEFSGLVLFCIGFACLYLEFHLLSVWQAKVAASPSPPRE